MRQGNDGGDEDEDDDDANDDDDDDDDVVVVDNGDGDSTSVGETEETIVPVARTTVEPDIEVEQVVVEEAYAQHVEVEDEETQDDGETGSATDSAEEEGIKLASSNAQ
jgi:hypothetical protein